MNKIAIRTEEAEYIEGDTVKGNVFLEIVEEVKCNGIIISVKGMEKVKWATMHKKLKEGTGIPDRPGEPGSGVPAEYDIIVTPHRAKHNFFKEQMKIGVFPEGVAAAGTYTFPFEYKLPDTIPGSFKYENKTAPNEWGRYKGGIIYHIRAMVDALFDEGKRIDAKQGLVINDKLDLDLKPEVFTNAGQVKFLCCIPRGMCTVRAWFNKIAFKPGETAQITTEVLNESSSEITHLVVKLFRTIVFRDRKNSTKLFRHGLACEVYDGLSPEECSGKPTPITIDENMMPTTKSQFIECRYHVEVETDIPYAPDIEVHVPVIIYSPQPETWGTEPWFPPVPLAVEYAPESFEVVQLPPRKIPKVIKDAAEEGEEAAEEEEELDSGDEASSSSDSSSSSSSDSEKEEKEDD